LKFQWGRRSDWMVFGSYPGLNVAAARTRARELKVLVSQGVNPKTAREDLRKAPTVAELAAKALAEHWNVRNRVASAHEVESLLDQWILPALGRKLVQEVTEADILQLRHAMRKVPTRANRAMAALSKLFNLAERWGHRPKNTNPVQGLERNPEKKRKRYLSPQEMALFARALVAQEETYPLPVEILRLLLFTGARKSEILGLRWEWVDLENGIVKLPPDAHKTGVKSGEKVLLLNAPALEIIKTLAGVRLGPFVFPGLKTGTHLVSLTGCWNAVLDSARAFEREDAKKAGRKPDLRLMADLRIHDLRHAFASYAIGTGSNLPVVGALLGHTQPSTTSRYAHLMDDPMRKATEAAGAAISKAMGGSR
jgi:integrase